MVPELENARVTELQVRMDCNGCVQRIKKAMLHIDGVYSMNIDLAAQKLTVVGTAEPEAIVKAIKKARKIATVCSHTEPAAAAPAENAPPAPSSSADQQPPPGDPPAPGTANDQPPAPPPEPPKDENNAGAGALELKPTPEAKGEEEEPGKEVNEIHMVHHYPPYCEHREQWSYCYPQRHHEMTAFDWPYHGSSPSYRRAASSSYAPRPIRYLAYEEDGGYYDHYGYRRGGGGFGGGGGSAFSEENPNACSIS